MKIRTLVVAVALLAALSVAAFLSNRPEAQVSADPRVGAPVLDRDTASRAAGLVVSDQGKTVELAKGAGGAWRVTSYYGLPADFEKVSRLVQDLNEAKVERLVTSSPDRLEHMEFKDSSITLRDGAGKDIWGVTFGKTPDSGNGRFIRFGSEPRAYFSGLHVWLDTDAKGWANADLLGVKPEDVAKVEIPFETGGTVTLSRATKDAPWAASGGPPGLALLPDRASSLVTALTSLRFTDTSDAKDPQAAEAARHARTFRLSLFDGRALTVSLGRKPEERKYRAPVADSRESLAAVAKAADAKPVAPEFDTVPAGPVYATASSPDPAAPVNDLMRRRAYQVDEYTFTGLPQNPGELFEAAKAK